MRESERASERTREKKEIGPRHAARDHSGVARCFVCSADPKRNARGGRLPYLPPSPSSSKNVFQQPTDRPTGASRASTPSSTPLCVCHLLVIHISRTTTAPTIIFVLVVYILLVSIIIGSRRPSLPAIYRPTPPSLFSAGSVQDDDRHRPPTTTRHTSLMHCLPRLPSLHPPFSANAHRS